MWFFSFKSFRELFSFSGQLLVTQLMDSIYRNIYYLVIGKYFTAVELGYYTRAEQFQSVASSNLQGVIGRVSYSILSTIQDDTQKLKEAYKKILKSTMLITFVLMLGMAAIAKPMILTLIGDKWEPCVIYLQLLCFVGMSYPLHALNLNILYVKGRSDFALRIEIIKKAMCIPIIVIAILWGIKAMIISMILFSVLAYFINSYWSAYLIDYSSLAQIKDISPSFLLAGVMSALVFVQGLIIDLSPLPTLLIQLATGAMLTFSICEILRYKDYLYIKNIIAEYFLHRNESP
jgi:O-antigen/teichoic acid export membrane protein